MTIPGFQNWTAAEHHADRTALSFSMLRHFGTITEGLEHANPGLFRAHLHGEVDARETAAIAFGTLAHLAVLEPDRLLSEIAVRPTKDDGTLLRANSNAYREWAAEHEGMRIVSPVDLDVLTGILDACARSPALAQLRRLPELFREKSIVWRDDDIGLLLKARPDSLRSRPDCVVCIDLKTTADASPDSFRQSCHRFGYFDRAAFYLDGLAAILGPYPRFAIVAVTKERPYQVAVYEPRATWIDEGRARNRALLREVARRIESDDWLAPWELEPVMI